MQVIMAQDNKEKIIAELARLEVQLRDLEITSANKIKRMKNKIKCIKSLIKEL